MPERVKKQSNIVPARAPSVTFGDSSLPEGAIATSRSFATSLAFPSGEGVNRPLSSSSKPARFFGRFASLKNDSAGGAAKDLGRLTDEV